MVLLTPFCICLCLQVKSFFTVINNKENLFLTLRMTSFLIWFRVQSSLSALLKNIICSYVKMNNLFSCIMLLTLTTTKTTTTNRFLCIYGIIIDVGFWVAGSHLKKLCCFLLPAIQLLAGISHASWVSLPFFICSSAGLVVWSWTSNYLGIFR